MTLDEFHPDTTWNPSLPLEREQGPTRIVARFTIDGEPMSKSRPRFTRQGHAYTPTSTREAMHRVGYTYTATAGQHAPRDDQTFGVMCLFYCGTWQRRDVDNMMKLVLDGLNKIAWADDAQVTELSGRVIRGAERARTEVVIYECTAPTRPTRPCLNCGKAFGDYPSQRQSRKFCEAACGYEYRRNSRQSNCLHCGATFHPAKNPKQLKSYCSSECKYAGGRVALVCAECGTNFTLAKSIANRSKTHCCSIACRAAVARRKRAVAARGTCEKCGGPTSKRQYRHCQACAYTIEELS
jgi:Holliday junction resolvase RusA-like endonuclease